MSDSVIIETGPEVALTLVEDVIVLQVQEPAPLALTIQESEQIEVVLTESESVTMVEEEVVLVVEVGEIASTNNYNPGGW